MLLFSIRLWLRIKSELKWLFSFLCFVSKNYFNLRYKIHIFIVEIYCIFTPNHSELWSMVFVFIGSDNELFLKCYWSLWQIQSSDWLSIRDELLVTVTLSHTWWGTGFSWNGKDDWAFILLLQCSGVVRKESRHQSDFVDTK